MALRDGENAWGREFFHLALVIDQGTGDQFTNSKGLAIVIYHAAKIVFNWLRVGDRTAMAIRSGGHCDNSG